MVPEPKPIYEFELPDLNVQMLGLSPDTYRWPCLGEFKSEIGFGIAWPWLGYRDERWYAEQMAAIQALQRLVAPHGDDRVRVKCFVALVPDAMGRQFALWINGTLLKPILDESPALRRRMLLKKMSVAATIAAARVEGGGSDQYGKRLGYGVSIDMQPFRSRGR